MMKIQVAFVFVGFVMLNIGLWGGAWGLEFMAEWTRTPVFVSCLALVFLALFLMVFAATNIMAWFTEEG